MAWGCDPWHFGNGELQEQKFSTVLTEDHKDMQMGPGQCF